MKYVLTKTFTREFPLIHVQMWGRRYVKTFLDEPLPKIPVYVFKFKNGLVTAYRNVAGQIDMVHSIIKTKFDSDPDFIDHLVALKSEELNELEIMKDKIDISQKEFIVFLDKLFDYWQLHYIAQFVPLDEKRFLKKDREKALELRKTIDAQITGFWISITPIMKRLYPVLGDLVVYISWDEVKNNRIPSLEELKLREKNGLVLFNDQIVDNAKLKKLSIQYDFTLEDNSDNISGIKEFSGEVACGGKARGRVRQILKADDIKFFSEGEILVSYMTMPVFMPAIKKAAALVTDEGGITSHAAIYARELDIPAVIGPKIATKALRDGDLVEVDANKGIVKILKRK